MGALGIFTIRLVLSIVFAMLLSRMFFQTMPMIQVFGLAIVLLGFAYLFEYLRNRSRGGGNGQ
jgi:hypothetical protein